MKRFSSTRAFRGGRAILLAIGVAASALFVGAPAADAAPHSWGPAVCMVNAPDSTLGLGHVGWAVREETNRWYIGATEGSNKTDNWERWDVTDAQFHQIFRDRGHYSTFRCHEYAAGSVWAAQSSWEAAKQRDYNLVYDNCLTRVRDVFNRFTNTSAFPDAVGWAPNAYYDGVLNDLGFMGRENV